MYMLCFYSYPYINLLCCAHFSFVRPFSSRRCCLRDMLPWVGRFSCGPWGFVGVFCVEIGELGSASLVAMWCVLKSIDFRLGVRGE